MFGSPTSRPTVVDALKRDGAFTDIALKDSTSETQEGSSSESSPDVEKGMKNASSSACNNESKKEPLLGTLSGVMLPCVQNILGVILFLRLPYIVAQAGLLAASSIILLSALSTLLTGLSLAAIASNGLILGGGPYYVISRTLGRELGGALGLLFYFGTTIGASMYVLGAIEAVQTGFGVDDLFDFDTETFSLVLMAMLSGIVAIGVKQVNRVAPLFLGIVLLSILSLSLGAILFSAGVFNGELESSDRSTTSMFRESLRPKFSPDPDSGRTPSFLSLLALFYPSVTGIMAGSNRSAVLANPSRSIGKGTLSAIGVTTFIYLFVAWLFGTVISREALLDNKLIVASVAWPFPTLVRVGIIMSCVGAGLQALAGAPRLLSAIAQDETIVFLTYVKPTSPSCNPLRAIFATYVIASLPCLAGNLNSITPIVTMSFLLMYAGINLSCFLLAALKAPSFRPTFHCFHSSTSLLGCLLCIALAFTIDYMVAAGAVGLLTLLVLYIVKTQPEAGDLGDIVQGIRLASCKSMLSKLVDVDETHAKNYFPLVSTLVQADKHGIIAPTESCLLRFCSQLKKGRGMTLISAIVPGSTMYTESKEAAKLAQLHLEREMIGEGLNGFKPDVIVCPIEEGYCISNTVGLIAATAGIGPLRPNTILMSWNEAGGASSSKELVRSLKRAQDSNKAILLLKGSPTFPGGSNCVRTHETIDVFWLCSDGGLLLLLPFLLMKEATWKSAKLRLFAGVTSAVHDIGSFRAAILGHLAAARIDAVVEVVDLSHLQDICTSSIPTSSGNAAQRIAMGSEEDDVGVGVEGTLLYQIYSPQKARPGTTGLPATPLPVNKPMNAEFTSDGYHSITPRRHLASEEVEGKEEDSIVANADTYSAIADTTLDSAAALNKVIRSRSGDTARLVVTNLPLLRPTTDEATFATCINALCYGLDNVLLVRGAGNEVITHYA